MAHLLPEEIIRDDARLVNVARKVRILRELSWPGGLAERFLATRGTATSAIPDPQPVRPPKAEDVEALVRLTKPSCDHPAAAFVAATAQSYVDAARLLEAAGTREFTDISTAIYGDITTPIGPTALSTLQAAQHLMRKTDALQQSITAEAPSVPSAEVKRRLSASLHEPFGEHAPKIELDPSLTSKAAAGSKRIRIRDHHIFTESDVLQLVHHEAMVHAATARNGRFQPHLQTLSLGAPRTTATQEGLATFAEWITNSLDLSRLRRIASRVIAIDRALNGADFIEVFEYFLEIGQSPYESFQSTARIFRGGDPRGSGSVFTKDAVYLGGLLRVHAFLHAALAESKPELALHLFCGRMALTDVVELSELVGNAVALPTVTPDWLTRRPALAANLTMSVLSHMFDLGDARVADFTG